MDHAPAVQPAPAKSWTRYSVEEQAAVVAYARASTIRGAARAYGMPYHTVRNWVAGVCQGPPESLVNEAKIELAETWEQIAYRATGELLKPGRIEAMIDADLVRTAAIATDKRQLLRGDPTSISAQVDPQERRKLLRAALMDAIESGALELDDDAESVPNIADEPVEAE